MFEVNVEAPMDLAQAVLPGMLDRGEGWIVNISSGAVHLNPGPPFTPNVMPGTASTASRRRR